MCAIAGILGLETKEKTVQRMLKTMSRRAIGQELMESRDLLPEDCDPVFFRPPGGFVTDGIRQVAQVRQLALLSWFPWLQTVKRQMKKG